MECTDGNTYMVVHAPEIDNASTTYDVDKVIKQLKLELEEVFEEDLAIEEFSKDTWNRAINKAIEIVKRGGENDNKRKYN